MTSQLQENDFIREIFQLGEKVVVNATLKGGKQSKLERVSRAAMTFIYFYPSNTVFSFSF